MQNREVHKNISSTKKLFLPFKKGPRILLFFLFFLSSVWIYSSWTTTTTTSVSKEQLKVSKEIKKVPVLSDVPEITTEKVSVDVPEVTRKEIPVLSDVSKVTRKQVPVVDVPKIPVLSDVLEVTRKKVPVDVPELTRKKVPVLSDVLETTRKKVPVDVPEVTRKEIPVLSDVSEVTRKKKVSVDVPEVTRKKIPVLSNVSNIPEMTRKKVQVISDVLEVTRKIEYPLNCVTENVTQTCSTSNYPITNVIDKNSNVTCPEYFRWIHEDLKPFKATGISRDMVERAKATANFRLVILKGKIYVEKYKKSIQTRDLFSIWGIVQLLRMYPGRLPDLEIMFDCNDRPVIQKRMYRGVNATAPPPLFRYCGDPWSLDIVFPDWSFWGWAEINIRPWEKIVKEMRKGNKRKKWIDREPYAYWKGNPFVAETRQHLLKCNVSENTDWNARLFIQDWIQEGEQGFKQSNVADQCTYRYKIYIEGYAWSVSEKYILACDSPTLLVNTKFYDFFLRHLQPLQHYWPIKDDDKCKSIKFAVDWGNNNTQKAQEMGKAASKFMLEELKMKNVYDYMFHLLNEYAKLIKFKVVIPPESEEVCGETMACSAAQGREKKFMMESLVKSPSITSPCILPKPYDPQQLSTILTRKVKSMKQVEKWQSEDSWKVPITTKV